MKKITAIIQSSCKSETIKNKSLIKLANDKTVLGIIVDSLRKMDVVDRIILATSCTAEDQALVHEANKLSIESYAGDFVNVIGRLKKLCAKIDGSILKVDGNRPLFDRFEAEKLVNEHMNQEYVYSFNGHQNGVVYGTDCEVFDSNIFNLVDPDSLSENYQECGTLYFRANPQMFIINAKKFRNPRPNYRVILETNEDVEIINNVLSNVRSITNEAIISFLDDNPIIADYNKLKQHEEVGLKKILLFPEKVKSITGIEYDKPDFTFPISVEFSITNQCNFDCIWCSDNELRSKQKDNMPLPIVRKLAKELVDNNTKGVTIEGGGEPTIDKNFNEIVEIFKKEGLSLGLITNGSVRLPERVVNQFDWIRVSLDVSNSEEMKNLKGYGNFEKIINNIRYFSNQRPVVGVGYVATCQNMNNIESLILRLCETNVRYIQIRPVVDHPELRPVYDVNSLQRYATPSFSIITSGMNENSTSGNNGSGCLCH